MSRPNPNPSKEQKNLPRPTALQIENWVRSRVDRVKERFAAQKGQRCLLIDNPGVSADTGLHVAVFPEDGRVKDFRPNMSEYNGDFVRFVAMVDGIRWIDAYSSVTGEANGTIEDMAKRMRFHLDTMQRETPIVEKPTDMIEMPKGYKLIGDDPDPLCRIAIEYLAKRQVSWEEARKLQIHYGVNSICFPYYEYGELVYWQTRDLLYKRYNFPTALNGQEFLYNLDSIEAMGDLFTTESFFNAAVIGSDASSAGTANLSRAQILKIKAKQPGRIILCPDHDPAGLASISHNFFALEKECVFKKANHGKILYAVPPKEWSDWNDYAVEYQRLRDPDVVRKEILKIARPVGPIDLVQIGKRIKKLEAERLQRPNLVDINEGE